ncbi:ABC transporter ATP-binding protein [Algibacter pectinivorans]|uniref:Putative ABC transport system ATP-binding protein n=1 Tax=Algibacter pectinivorans TaxID=870482 RepID=A0A1I1S6I3_9FLAO|nr:ATP-binding cassette domain-containing protein [Algibacter pectinivorans]SFD39433.1 putative ABC transport system ATP-binding protein [Algibacter pectinivorans]
MLRTENLTFKYTQQLEALRFPDINLKTHENLLILGESGVGKTTLLHLLSGLLKPVTGKIFIQGVPINTLTQRKLDAFRGQEVGLVFQKSYAIKTLNVIENLSARLFFSKTTVNIEDINNLLNQLGLKDCKNNNINELSEGQLQRLAIALAVVHKPKVILADEPTSSLDDNNCKIVMELLVKQAKQTHAHLIVITHDHRVKPFFKNAITL